MKNGDKNNKCEILEEQTLSNPDRSMDEWKNHAKSCHECEAKIQLLNNISDSIDNLDLTMGNERMENLEKALKEKMQASRFLYLYKYAAVAAVVLACFIIIESMKTPVTQKITKRVPNVNSLVQEPTDSDLEWDYKFDKRKAKMKVAKLNRYITESRRENGYLKRFKKRCKETKNKINNLKNKEVFM